MLLEVERLLGRDLGDSLLSERQGIVTDQHFANSCFPADMKIAKMRRESTMNYGVGLKMARVVILTLGLNEVWFAPNGLALNNHPDMMLMRHRDNGYTFSMLTVDDNVSALNEIYRLIKRVNPSSNIIVTVSPVPLQTTFTGMDVVEANQLGKATLLVAAQQFVNGQADVSYFPSYEIVMNSDPSLAWKADKRHVQPGLVEFIVSTFREATAVPESR